MRKRNAFLLIVAAIVCALGLGALVASLYSVFSLARVRARAQTSAQNMSALHKAFTMYEVDYGRFPVDAVPDQSLFLLYRQYVDDFRVFYNPNDMREKPIGEPREGGASARIRTEFADSCGYMYLPGYSSADGNAIFYYERFPTANRRNVLYVNGQVDLIDEAEFQNRLTNNPKPVPIAK